MGVAISNCNDSSDGGRLASSSLTYVRHHKRSSGSLYVNCRHPATSRCSHGAAKRHGGQPDEDQGMHNCGDGKPASNKSLRRSAGRTQQPLVSVPSRRLRRARFIQRHSKLMFWDSSCIRFGHTSCSRNSPRTLRRRNAVKRASVVPGVALHGTKTLCASCR